jgi:hypothetical protein
MRGDGGGEGPESQPMSTAVHITWHGAQINFGNLPPYITFDLKKLTKECWKPHLGHLQLQALKVVLPPVEDLLEGSWSSFVPLLRRWTLVLPRRRLKQVLQGPVGWSAKFFIYFEVTPSRYGQNQCWGSGSAESACFWATRIRIH